MTTARQLSLIIAIVFWATILGAIVYSHIVYFPPYLGNLPESNNLIKAEYGLHEENFWMFIHPFAILSTILTLILNWKLKQRRQLIIFCMAIYAAVIIATATYFVPELIDFAASTPENSNATNLLDRGQKWQYWSWARGVFMYLGFTLLVVGLTKNEQVQTTTV